MSMFISAGVHFEVSLIISLRQLQISGVAVLLILLIKKTCPGLNMSFLHSLGYALYSSSFF